MKPGVPRAFKASAVILIEFGVLFLSSLCLLHPPPCHEVPPVLVPKVYQTEFTQ